MSERESLLCKVLELVAVGRGSEGFRTVVFSVVELLKRDNKTSVWREAVSGSLRGV